MLTRAAESESVALMRLTPHTNN